MLGNEEEEGGEIPCPTVGEPTLLSESLTYVAKLSTQPHTELSGEMDQCFSRLMPSGINITWAQSPGRTTRSRGWTAALCDNIAPALPP